jgi:hypothetical protein
MEVFDEFIGNGAGFIPVSCVKSRLSATGLVGIIFNVTSQFFQHLHHIEACFREQLIYEAWNKKLYVH